MTAPITPLNLTRRSVLLSLVALNGASIAVAASPITVQVWKDPNCGCCKDWIAHLEKTTSQQK